MGRKRGAAAGQLSFFDIELPPNDAEQVAETIIEAEPEPVRYNFATVPDSEYQYTGKPENVPTVNELANMIEKGLYRVGAHEFLADLFECAAIAISNKFDKPQAAKREAKYLQIINKYDKDTQQLLVEVFTKLYCLLSQQIHPAVGFGDYLGELYMRSQTSNSKAGQFFTPYNLSKMCVEVAVDETLVKEYMEQDKIITLSEPACGSGGMILAAADVLYNKYHFNISRNLYVECSDIDRRCVHMCYLQLSLAGIPAVIYQQNTLTLETWDRWETPAYIMQWLRFRSLNQKQRDRNEKAKEKRQLY